MRDITRPDVWAPSASKVTLVANGDRIPLTRGDGGWWRAPRLVPGTRYQFVLDDGSPMPDPRSLAQDDGPHGPSRIVDPRVFLERPAYAGIDLRGKVLYELHVGTFTDEGTFDSAISRLDYLKDLGVDGVEVMPVADFPGKRGWGYDGVGMYATHAAYGGPEAFVRFVDAAHARGLGVILDVVHNHLGPEGNYLAHFGPYFTPEHTTPWGDAINLDQPGSDEVRAFLLGAVRQWVVDFRLDGLRLDAVHALRDDSQRHFLAELAERAEKWAAEVGRPLFVTAESDLNQPAMVTPFRDGGDARGMDAQWADDVHHALHAFWTGETDGYYCDFGTVEVMQKALTRVFVHDGNHSTFREQTWGAPLDRKHGHYDGHSFIVSAQNHDQVGNRASGDRMGRTVSPAGLAAVAATYLLSAYTPMMFMGEEWNASTPFPFFSHLGPELGPLVTEGRAQEFAAMDWKGEVPDPQAESTFLSAKLRWSERHAGDHRRMLEWYRKVLRLRRELPGTTEPSLTSSTVDIIDDDTYVLHRPGFAVVASRADAPRTVHVNGKVLAAWNAERSKNGIRIGGPGVAVVATTDG